MRFLLHAPTGSPPPSRAVRALATHEDDSYQVIIEPDQCDLEHADFAPQLSAAGRDESRQLVYTTIDRVAYRPAPEIVDTVLDANGFALNLENILACLDEVRVGHRIRLAKKQPSADALPIVDVYAPALTLRLPAKNRVGPLLAKFYAEVDAYQAELARLREEKGRAQGGQRKEVEALKRERDQLKEQNEILQAKLDDMTREVAMVRKAHAEATKALAAQNMLPSQVRLAQVHEVDLGQRYVALKSGRKVFSIPLVALMVYPKESDPCLVSIQDGEVVGVFFHERAQNQPGTRLAEVLHVAAGKVKIREENRRTRVIESQNPAEEALINQLRRGHQVLLFLHENKLIRFTPCTTNDPDAFARAVQESITRWELSSGEPTLPPGSIEVTTAERRAGAIDDDDAHAEAAVVIATVDSAVFDDHDEDSAAFDAGGQDGAGYPAGGGQGKTTLDAGPQGNATLEAGAQRNATGDAGPQGNATGDAGPQGNATRDADAQGNAARDARRRNDSASAAGRAKDAEDNAGSAKAENGASSSPRPGDASAQVVPDDTLSSLDGAASGRDAAPDATTTDREVATADRNDATGDGASNARRGGSRPPDLASPSEDTEPDGPGST